MSSIVLSSSFQTIYSINYGFTYIYLFGAAVVSVSWRCDSVVASIKVAFDGVWIRMLKTKRKLLV